MEQLSFIEESLQENVIKQMQKAVRKGIVPGAIVIFDNDKKDRNIVKSLFLGSENKIEVSLISESGYSVMSYPALSDRVSVVDYYKL